MPTLFVIAGCNGAGKTTLSKNLLPQFLGVNEFVNADEIARGLSPFNAEQAAFAAGRIMLERIHELAKAEANFAIETTLSSKSYAPLFKEMKKNGYEIFLIFVYLQSAGEAIKRVEQRVKKGGHNIPVHIIKRRFERGLKNLAQIYLPICDGWAILDNTAATPIFVAEKKAGNFTIHDDSIWNKIITHDQG
jgi:predicted ABC-type ATPase